MPGLTVDPEALLASVDQMSQFESQLEQSLARVKASVLSLGMSWHGDAAGAAALRAGAVGHRSRANCVSRSVSCVISPSGRTATNPALSR